MAATTTDSRDFDVQVLEDTVRGHFAGKNAMMDSALVSGGAVIVNDSMPRGPEDIGNEITVPYFGVVGEFADNAEDTAVTPSALKMTNEKATVGRSSLAFEVTRWARHSGPSDADPYTECSQQIGEAAKRDMDRLMVAAAATTPLVRDLYSATVPVYLDWDFIVDGRAMWGDEQDGIVGMVVHSRVEAGLRKLRDANGRPLLLDNMLNSDIPKFCGVPLLVSDRVPLTASTMSPLVMTEAGTTPPDMTLSGTPLGAWDFRIKIILGGARGTFTFQFSTDGGNTWSATILSAASVVLTDTAADSLVGVNGRTGLTVAIENAAANVDNTYSSKALLKATSLILQRGAMTFWYSRRHMGLETDKDILKHNDVAAMHIYRVAHMYRRRRGGSKPGVVALKHNVPGFAA
jgi:hypothetical protein